MRESRTTRIVLAILVLVSITLVIIDLRGSSSGPTAFIRSAGAAVVAPLERVSGAIFGPVLSLGDSLGSLGEKDAQIADLEAENARLKSELDVVANDKARVAELDALMGLAGNNGYETVPAQVIAVGPAQGFAWTVTIDVGSRDGVEPSMSVISGAGLVGRTISVTPTTATVLLVVDATSSVGARLPAPRRLASCREAVARTRCRCSCWIRSPWLMSVTWSSPSVRRRIGPTHPVFRSALFFRCVAQKVN